MIQTAVANALVADAALTALLGAHDGAPAVFVGRDVPVAFQRSGKVYVLLPGERDTSPYLDGERDFFAVEQEIYVAAEQTHDPSAVSAAASQVRATLEAATVTPTGYDVASGGVQVEGPAVHPVDDLTEARRLLLRLWLIKQ